MKEREASLDKVLFIDDAQVTSMHGVERRVHPGEKYEGNPVLGGDSGLEKQAIVGTVLRENGLYRMWYQLGRYKWHNYAESDDGINWRKPVMGKYRDLKGSYENNLFLDPEVMNHDFSSVMKTPHMGNGRGYTLIAWRRSGHHICFSEDGLRWTDWSSKPVIPVYGDIGWYTYNDRDRLFRGMVKRILEVRGMQCRIQNWTESTDGYEWSLPRPAIVPDEKDDQWTEGDPNRNTQIYSIPIVRYGPLLLGFMDVFRCTDARDLSKAGVIDTQLVSSRDGRNWERVGDRRPIVGIGQRGSWDGGLVGAAKSLVEDGQELRLYYTGTDHPHGVQKIGDWKKAIGMVRWRKDRLVGLLSGGEGEVVTVPMPAGRELHINANASSGRITAELLHEDGSTVGGFESGNCVPLAGQDSLDHQFEWQDTALRSVEKGQEKAIRLRLGDAEVFSLWWE